VLNAAGELSKQPETLRAQVESFLSGVKVAWSAFPGRDAEGTNPRPRPAKIGLT